jgi:hypothetical protein
MNFRLKSLSAFGLLVFLCLLLPNVAKADSFAWTYEGSFLFVGPLISGSGILTTANGVIVAMSGTFDGEAITSLIAPGDFDQNDNVLIFPGAPLLLTTGGVSFIESVGTQINLYGDPFVTDPQLQYGVLTDSNDVGLGIFTITPAAAVPEAGTSTLLLVGVLGLVLAVIRNGLGRSDVNS